jgi:hypothetical protein
MTYQNTDQLTNTQRRERWCGAQTKRAEDITPYDVIKWNKQWTEVFQVYRTMDEWEAEFGAIGGITDPDILPGQPSPEYRRAAETLDWAVPTWVLLRLLDRGNATPDASPDIVVRLYKYDLVEVQTLPAFLPSAITTTIKEK